jgi:hypothetical protein
MVLKGLALGAAAAVVAVAIFVALSAPPARMSGAAPSNSVQVMLLPNGIAAPQLQPLQQGAPALIEGETSLAPMTRVGTDQVGAAAMSTQQLSAGAPSAANTSQSQAVLACGDK